MQLSFSLPLNGFKSKYSVFELNEQSFNAAALELFRFQAAEVPVYREYLQKLEIDPKSILSYEEIPCLPIEFFKNFRVSSRKEVSPTVFKSSSTSGQGLSSHEVYDLNSYNEGSVKIFESFYGPLKDYCILALLPSYLERGNSSLVHMVKHFMDVSAHPSNGFYLHNHDELKSRLELNESQGQKTLFIGVSYALLDFGESYPIPLKNTLVMETGGMKGRKKEITREELHGILKKAFSLAAVHSEYGMTELLSQAYSQGEGKFRTAAWMKILVRDLHDPFGRMKNGQSGAIDVIDLLNVDSCAFISTSDLGKLHPDGSFEVLGRFDFSDIRGCSLML